MRNRLFGPSSMPIPDRPGALEAFIEQAQLELIYAERGSKPEPRRPPSR